MSAGIKVAGEQALKGARDGVLAAANRALLEAGIEGHARLRAALSLPAQGGHSAPGEPPRTDTGRLLNSMACSLSQTADGARLELGDLGARTPYAAMLEEGTSRMRPRPFLAGRAQEIAGSWAEKFSALLRGQGREK